MIGLKAALWLATTIAGTLSLSYHIMNPTPETLASSPFTQETIGFFGKYTSGLETVGLHPNICLVKHQPVILSLFLRNIELEDIPEKIEPGLRIQQIRISGYVLESPKPSELAPSQTFHKLMKLLHALGEVQVDKLHLKKFNMIEDGPATAIPLTRMNELAFYEVSPFFLEWFCEIVDLSGCTFEFNLMIVNCGVESVHCLSKLGISTLKGLNLSDLPKLTQLDCQMPNTTKDNELTLCADPLVLNLSTDIVDLIAEAAWKRIVVNMDIWNKIVSVPGTKNIVAELLVLEVTDWKDFQVNGHVQRTAQARMIDIYDIRNETVLSKAFFMDVFGWMYENAEGVEMVRILVLYAKSVDLEIKTFLEDNDPIDQSRLPSLKTLMVEFAQNNFVWSNTSRPKVNDNSQNGLAATAI
ncbi:hypothetical protein NEDG_02225 [Nematocida displodere]|uniref:Uncharacterized protein n=1 Tax=Nematocida displodere TaxID=1805483 RepID=A0A177EMC2_9MICR|nr:hypothetical protein NEDG_02225 [Nematocida displodere]